MSISTPTIPLATGARAITFVVQTTNNTAGPALLTSGDSQIGFNRIFHFFKRLATTGWNSNVTEIVGGAYATGTATLASVVATNTIVIGGVTLTATNSSTPSSVQFKVGANDTATAANLAAAINALTTINKVVQATSALAVVTIASLVPGTIGNLITLSSTGGTITVGANLTSGTDGTKYYASHGL